MLDEVDALLCAMQGCTIQSLDARSLHHPHLHLTATQCISYCITVHLTASQCTSLQHSSSHYNSVHPLHPILVHPPPLHQAGTSSYGTLGQGSLGAGELGSMRWRLFVAHRVLFDGSGGFFFYKYRGVKRIWLNTRPFKFQTGWV